MKSDTRRQRMAELFGDEDLVSLIPKEKTPEEKAAENETSREAEAMLALLDGRRNARIFLNKNCRRCGGYFLSDYACVAYCSDSCRRRALELMGIQWDETKSPEERWGFPVPLIIPPSLVDRLSQALQVPVVVKSELFEQDLQEQTLPSPQVQILESPIELTEFVQDPDEPQTQLSEFEEFSLELLDEDFDVLP